MLAHIMAYVYHKYFLKVLNKIILLTGLMNFTCTHEIEDNMFCHTCNN